MLGAVRPIDNTEEREGEPETVNDEDVSAEDIGEGVVRGPKYIRDIRLPSLEEFQKHMMTHLPYRSWCEHCVKSRGKEAPRRAQSTESDLPEVSMDFCFPFKDDGTGGLIILVARERHTRMTLATVVPSKSTGMFPARRVVEFLQELVVVLEI